MKKKKKSSVWDLVARLILRNRLLILASIIILTGFWATQWKYMQFTFTEANLLPDDHPENIQYQEFVKTFGDEGNLIVIAVQDSLFFKSEKRNAWRDLNTKINDFKEISFVLSIDNIKELVKNPVNQNFDLKLLKFSEAKDSLAILAFKEKLFSGISSCKVLINSSKSIEISLSCTFTGVPEITTLSFSIASKALSKDVLDGFPFIKGTR